MGRRTLSDSYECVTRDCSATFSGPRKGGKCPECGLPVMTPRRFRILQWVRIGAGLVLVGIMAPVLYYLAPILLDPASEFSTESESTPMVVLGLLVVLLGFGVTMTIGVAMEIRAGARSRNLTRLALIMLIAVLAIIAVLGVVEPEMRGSRYGI